MEAGQIICRVCQLDNVHVCVAAVFFLGVLLRALPYAANFTENQLEEYLTLIRRVPQISLTFIVRVSSFSVHPKVYQQNILKLLQSTALAFLGSSHVLLDIRMIGVNYA